MGDTATRRDVERYHVIENRARIRWKLADSCQETPARILGLTQAGAWVKVEPIPALGRDLELRLEEPTMTEWIPVGLVSSEQPDTVRLIFLKAYPYDLYKAIIPRG